MSEPQAAEQLPEAKTPAQMNTELRAVIGGQDGEAALIALLDTMTVAIAFASGPNRTRAVAMTDIIMLEIKRELFASWDKIIGPQPTGPMQ